MDGPILGWVLIYNNPFALTGHAHKSMRTSTRTGTAASVVGEPAAAVAVASAVRAEEAETVA